MSDVKLRRSLLYVSGASPVNMAQAPYYDEDCIIYDLEDSVPLDQKDVARFLVYNTVRYHRPRDKEVIVRVNAINTPFGKQDLEAIVRSKPDVIRFPKIETPQDVLDACAYIKKIEVQAGIEAGSTKIIAGMESHIGVLNAREIATSSPRIVAISLGGEDYTASLMTERSKDGLELFYGRNTILLAARAAGVQAIDTVYADINDEEGLIEETKQIKKLGFDGKYLIHPRQIDPVNKIFTPTKKEIEYAIKVFDIIEEGKKQNKGAIALEGSMIDEPMVKRARTLMARAKAAGIKIGGDYYDD
jgi:citrate lyase subunit beta/citryl-CoA lyase